MMKTTRARYTLGFKQEAVRLVEGGQSIAAAARTLGVVDQALHNWVKAQRVGKLTGADSKLVSAEQMEISRLRAELARVKMERDIRGKATAYFAKGNCWDNACSETLFGSLKVERLHGQRFESRRQATDEVVAWLLWYNRARLHSTLDYVSPLQFEENCLASQPRQASA